MASPFDADVPSWLLPKKSPADYFAQGQEVGSQIASNIIRARSLQMQSEEQAAQIGNIMATTELKKEQLQSINQENAAWMNEDSKTVPKWMMTPLGKLDTTATPEPKSQRGMEIVQKRIQAEEQFKLRDDTQKATMELRKNQFEINKLKADNATGTEKALSDGDKDFVRGLNMLDADQRIGILGPEPKQPHFTPTQWDRLNSALKAKGINLQMGKNFKDPEPVLLQRQRDEYLKQGNTKAAQEIDNILAAKGHLGVPAGAKGSGKLSGEDLIKEKDLTKRIQVTEKELDDAKRSKAGQSKLIPIQERLLELQSQRHKLYQKLAPATETKTAPAATPTSIDKSEALRQAREAISAGKDPTIIKQRLKAMGIDEAP